MTVGIVSPRAKSPTDECSRSVGDSQNNGRVPAETARVCQTKLNVNNRDVPIPLFFRLSTILKFV